MFKIQDLADSIMFEAALKDKSPSFFVDYLIMIFCADIYGRFLEEKLERKDVIDSNLSRIIRIIKTSQEEIDAEIQEHLSPQLTPGLSVYINRALKRPATYQGVIMRAVALRTVFNRLPSMKIRSAFASPRDYQIVSKAAEASGMEDEVAAMSIISGLVIRTSLIKTLVKRLASLVAGGKVTKSAESTIEGVQTQTSNLSQVVKQKEVTAADTEEYTRLEEKEKEITDNIKTISEDSSDQDEPVTKSDVVAIATTVVAHDKEIKAFATMDEPPDSEQKAAVMTSGKVLVAAGAGAGKTKTLTAKVAYLIKDKNVDPSTIFVTTFTQAAAKEMKQRIEKQVGAVSENAFIGTFHSFSLNMLRNFASPIYKQAINNSMESSFKYGRLMNMAIEEYEDNNGKSGLSPKEAILIVSKWKYDQLNPEQAQDQVDAMVTTDPEEAMKVKAASKIYAIFETLKGRHVIDKRQSYYPESEGSRSWFGRMRSVKKTPLIDFDDMQSDFLTLLQNDPRLKEYLQKKFKHFIMDECQDSNNVQLKLFDLMTEKVDENGDAWMVGDDSQSIYGFRGAKPEAFVSMASNPQWKLRKIRTNYRSNPEIVQAANKLIEHNQNRIPMEAVPNKKDKANIELKRDEIENLANDAISTVKSSAHADLGSDLSDFAVLARTNNELHDFEAACIVRGVPYSRRGGQNFFNRKEVKSIVDYITLATSENVKAQNEALLSVYDYPNRFLGGKFKKFLEEDRSHRPFIELLDDVDFQAQFARQSRNVQKLYNDISNLRELAKTKTTNELVFEIMELEGEKGKIKDYLQRDAQDEEVENNEDVKQQPSYGGISYLLKMAEPDPSEPLLDPTKPSQFLTKVDNFKEMAKKLKSDKGVVLSTIHGAKGLQWQQVFAVMQNPRADAKEERLEEERRMAYVQITRAKNDLTILSPKHDQRGKPAILSVFITEAGLDQYSTEQHKASNEYMLKMADRRNLLKAMELLR